MLLNHQEEHAFKIKRDLINNQIVIDSSDPGTGKTFVSSSVVKDLKRHAFVICPLQVMSYWAKTLNEFDVDTYDIVNYETLKSGYSYKTKSGRTSSFDKVKCPYSYGTIKEPKYNFPSNVLVIFDEIHVCKNKTYTNKMLNAIIKSKVKILGLSATLTDGNAFIDTKHVHRMILNNPFNNTISVHIYGENHKIISLDDVQKVKAPFYSGQSIKKQHKKRMVTEMNKIPYYINLFKKNKTKSVIIFCNFNETIHQISMKLKKYNPLIVNGLNKRVKNKDNISKFNSGESKLIILNSMSGGASINLHDKTGDNPRCTIMGTVWSGGMQRQELYRGYRTDGKSDVDQHIICLDDELDLYVLWVSKHKMDKIDKLNQV